MEKIIKVSSEYILMDHDNVDTDQIIPARYLKTMVKEGLSKYLFFDMRFTKDGRIKDNFPIKEHVLKNGILVTGDNFGCGSSREHAPWALYDFGFRVIVSTSFADIFCTNALKNGLLTVEVSPEFHRYLFDAEPHMITVDLESETITSSKGKSSSFHIDHFSRYCLLNGIDELGFLLQCENDINNYEKGI